MAGEGRGAEREQTTDEVSKRNGRRQNWGPFDVPGEIQEKPVYCLGGVRHKGGGTLILAPVRNVGTCRPDVKGETQVETTRG